MGRPFFKVPLNLPHAATIASRLVYHVNRFEQKAASRQASLDAAEAVSERLSEFRFSGENPDAAAAQAAVAEVAALARRMVDAFERDGIGDDRLGQAVRNLFECLELGEEGAEISLRAGENPDSALRPV